MYGPIRVNAVHTKITVLIIYVVANTIVINKVIALEPSGSGQTNRV